MLRLLRSAPRNWLATLPWDLGGKPGLVLRDRLGGAVVVLPPHGAGPVLDGNGRVLVDEFVDEVVGMLAGSHLASAGQDQGWSRKSGRKLELKLGLGLGFEAYLEAMNRAGMEAPRGWILDGTSFGGQFGPIPTSN